jgi:AI-2 transport protein TqsA
VSNSFSPVSRALIIMAALVIIIAGMKHAAPILVPFLLAVFIAVISFPFMSKLQEKGLPKGLSLILVIVLVIFIGTSLMMLIGSSLTDFSQMLPVYREKISSEWLTVIQWLSDHGVSVTEDIRENINPAAVMGFASSILKAFGSVLTNSFLILLAVTFILIEAAGLARKISSLTADQASASETPFSQVFVDKLRNYMGIKTIISMITGFIIGVAMWLIGVDYPVLWGVLAFMLNFVPSIGSIIAAVPAILLALVQLGSSTALFVAVVFLVVNIVIGSFIEPKYMGKGLGLSVLVVFSSLIFWGWVLGPVGMLLSVPLTITIKLALDSKPDTQWLGHLLGPVDY